MLAPNDQKHVDYCAANNGGKCQYKCRTCDGLCNNCPLDIAPGDCITTGLQYTPRTAVTSAELDYLEGRCLPPCDE